MPSACHDDTCPLPCLRAFVESTKHESHGHRCLFWSGQSVSRRHSHQTLLLITRWEATRRELAPHAIQYSSNGKHAEEEPSFTSDHHRRSSWPKGQRTSATRQRSALPSRPCRSGCATTRTASSLSTRCCSAPLDFGVGSSWLRGHPQGPESNSGRWLPATSDVIA